MADKRDIGKTPMDYALQKKDTDSAIVGTLAKAGGATCPPESDRAQVEDLLALAEVGGPYTEADIARITSSLPQVSAEDLLHKAKSEALRQKVAAGVPNVTSTSTAPPKPQKPKF